MASSEKDRAPPSPSPSTDGEATAVAASEKRLEENQQQDDRLHLAAPGQDAQAGAATALTDEDITAEKEAAAAPAADADDGPHYSTGARLWLIVLALSLALFVCTLDMSIVATATPRITNQFHSLNDVGWYGAAYQISCAPMQLMSGKLYTYFKTKWTFLVFFGVFELGSLICGVAQSSVMLIVGRAVAGLGSAGLQNGSLTVLNGLAPPVQRAFLTGLILGVAQLGIVAGPLLGGVFTQLATWRWCFYVNLPIGAVVAGLIFLIHIPEQTPKLKWRRQPPGHVKAQLRMVFRHRLDFPGFFLFAGATIMLLLALQWGGSTYPWKSSVVIGLFVGAGATFAVWAAWNQRVNNWKGNAEAANENGEAALLPTSIVRIRVVWASVLTTFTLMGAVITQSYFLAIYFQAARDTNPIMSGVDILPTIISQMIAAVATSVLIGKMGYYLPWGVAGLAISAVGTGLMTTLSPTTTTGQWIGYQILTGVGRGLVFQVPFIALQHAVGPKQISVAMGLLSFGQNFGGAILLTVANTIFGNSLRTELAAHAPGVAPDVVIAAGATAFRTVVPAASIPGVILAYANSVDRTFYLGVAVTAASFFISFLMGWKDIRPKKDAPEAAVAAAAAAATDAKAAQEGDSPV